MDWLQTGVTIRALRIRTSLTQAQLGARALTSREVVAAIEHGRADEVQLAELDRVVAALGAGLDLQVRWRGERLDRLLDEAHAATVAAIVERLTALGWETVIEASFSIWGERGSIDVLAWHAATRTVLVIEVKSVLADVQSLLHGVDRKARLAAEIIAERGWVAASVARLVVIAESPTSRGRVRRHAAILDRALPMRGAAVRAWLRNPVGTISGLLFLSNASLQRNRTPIWRRERVRTRSPRRNGRSSPPMPPDSAIDKDPAPDDGRGPG